MYRNRFSMSKQNIHEQETNYWAQTTLNGSSTVINIRLETDQKKDCFCFFIILVGINESSETCQSFLS